MGTLMSEMNDQILACIPRLIAYSKHLNRGSSDSEDVVYDVVSSLLERHRGDGFSPDNVEAWCIRSIRNRSVDIWRKQGRMQYGEDPDDHKMDPIHMGRTSNPEDRLLLEECLKLRTPEHREVLLAFGFGYTYQQISDMYEIPVGTVMSRLARARRELGDCMGQ